MKAKDQSAQDAALISDLIAAPSDESTTQVSAPPPAAPRSEARPRPAKRTQPNIYDKLMDSIAYGAAIAISFGLWFAGAYFTLQFLAGIGINLAKLSYAQWLIPIAITACELRLWPRNAESWQRWLLWLAVLAFDVGTSFAGMAEAAAGQTFALFNGISFPEQGIGLWATAGIAALFFAFIPEKLARWAGAELLVVWK